MAQSNDLRIANLRSIIALAEQEIRNLQSATFSTNHTTQHLSLYEAHQIAKGYPDQRKISGEQSGCQMPQGHPSHCGCPPFDPHARIDLSNPPRDNTVRPL